MTAIALLVAKYGWQRMFSAIGGDPALAPLAVELVQALLASEDGLGKQLTSIDSRLAGIERRLDEAADQPYSSAIDTGLRTLLDAGMATSVSTRREDLQAARELFRKASGAARSNLQIASAERYLVLCALALGRDDAARAALGQLRSAAVEALLDASNANIHSRTLAGQRLEPQQVGRRKRDDRIRAASARIKTDARKAEDLAMRLLQEAGVLAQTMGYGTPPNIVPDVAPAAGVGLRRWHIRFPAGTNPAWFGPFQITWNLHDAASAPNQRLHVEVTMNVDPPLAQPVYVTLAKPYDGYLMLEAGAQACQLRSCVPLAQYPAPTARLIIGSRLIVESRPRNANRVLGA